MKKILLDVPLTLFLLSFTVHAASIGTISKVSGKVQVKSENKIKKARRGMKVSLEDTVVGRNGSVHIKIKDRGDILAKGDFSLKLKREKKEKRLRTIALAYGNLRLAVKNEKKNKLRVRTKTVTMGVRGTDFIAIYNPVLGESEIVCFEGRIKFTARKDKKTIFVKENQWGGHGGRFGKLKPPMDLPESVINHFKSGFKF